VKDGRFTGIDLFKGVRMGCSIDGKVHPRTDHEDLEGE
jgi:hypothetical protein